MKRRRVIRTLRDPEKRVPSLAIRSEREHDGALARLSHLVDEIGRNPKDPRYHLLDTLVALFEAYDKERHQSSDVSAIPDATTLLVAGRCARNRAHGF